MAAGPVRPALQKLGDREEKKIAANPKYRTPPRTLKRLAEAHMFYDFQPSSDNRASINNQKSSINNSRDDSGPWDTFSTRTLGLLINRRMAREFNSDHQKIRQASLAQITRALNLTPAHWPQT